MSDAARGRCGPMAVGTCFLVILLLVLVSVSRCEERNDIRRKEVVAGDNITLTCYAQPGQLRAYRWVYIRAGTRRPQVLSSGRRLVVGEPRLSLVTKSVGNQVALQLTLSDVKLYESGVFMCWRQGLRPDPQVLLTVLEPGTSSEKQVISSLTGPSEVQYGEAAAFTCTITPAWPVKVTWLKNNAVLPTSARLFKQTTEKKVNDDGTDEVLVATLSVASVRKNKNFTCRIDTEPPVERSVEVVVRVPKVHALTADPDKDTVEYGQPLKLTCVVSGTNSEVVWLKDGSEMTFGPEESGREKFSAEHSPGMTASTVYIDSLSFEDNGHYVCYIPGASKDILINIEGRPPRVLGVTGGNFFEDEPLILRCSTQYVKNFQSPSVSWKFQSVPLDPSQYEARVERSQYNVTVHELIIPRGRPHHTGTYECVTPYGSASINVDLFVPPSLGEPLPSEDQVEEGQSLEVNCKAVGRPPPLVQWEKLVEGIWVLASDIDGVYTQPDGLLRIDTASLDHAGEYRCAATSEAGSFLAEVFIHVQRIPAEVVEMMSPEGVLEGDNFTVLCTVANYLGPVEFWFGGHHLDPGVQPRYSVETYLRDDGFMQVYLTVLEATLEDSGLYECHAGTDAFLATVVEVDKRPGEVLELTVSPPVEGQDFFVSCTVKDWLKEVTFYHNGEVIFVEDDYHYSIYSPPPPDEEGHPVTHVLKVTKALPQDAGVYQCFLDGYTSATVTVEVEEPKEEVLSIAASPAVIGHDFNITCRVRNWEEEVTFIHNNVVIDSEREWRYEVTKLPDEGDGTKTHILTITTAAPEDSGNYECFTSPLSSGAVSVEIWREAEVTLDLQTLDRPNWRDSPIPINCIVEGVDPNKVTVLFSHEETPQVAIQNKTKMSTSNHLVNIAITEAEDADTPITTFTIGFYSITQDLTGPWTCEVLHPGGFSLGKDELYIKVAEVPTFAIKPPEEVFEDLEADLYLNCSTSGPHYTTVAWFRKGIPEPITSQTQSASLFIPGFTSTDEGEYYCLATLNDREIRADTVLKLRTPQPRIVSVTAAKGVEGEDLTITCTVAYWNGEVLFFINTEAVYPEQSTRYSLQRHPGVDETVAHVLTVHNASQEDAGVAECFLSLEEFGSTIVEVEGATTVPSSEVLEVQEPTLPPGRIVDLQGPVLVEEGTTLTLTCLISPVIPHGVLLTRDTFVLYVDDVKYLLDDRFDMASGTGVDGTRFVYLKLAEVSMEDGGEYGCATNTDPPASASWIVNVVPPGTLAESTTVRPTSTTIATTPAIVEYEDLGLNVTLDKEGCTFPAEWVGEWNVPNRDDEGTITKTTFFKGRCIAALPDRDDAYIIEVSRRKKDCVRCLVITEKHSNFLEYKKSPKCQSKQDYESLCSSAESSEGVTTLIRAGASTVCPFTGSRSFSFQKPVGVCDLEPSKLSSTENDTVLYFIYNPCPKQTNPNIFGYPEKVRCMATWSEDGAHYMVGKLLSLHGSPQYRCYIYEEKLGEAYRYSMTRTSSYCGANSYDYEFFYRINDESIAPGVPDIEGYNATMELEVGFPLRLTCRSSGGFPLAKLKWYKNGEEIPSDSLEVEGQSQNHLDVVVQEDDHGAEYSCEASNFADTLTSSILLFLYPTTTARSPTSATTTTTTSEYYDYDMEGPVFIDLPEAVYEVERGDSLVLPCVAEGFPEPHVQWKKQMDSNRFSSNETDRELGVAVLLLTNITEAANYVCQAKSLAGVISQDVEIRVLPEPEPPTPRVTVLGMTTVAVEWDDVELPSTPYVLRYNKRNGTTHEIVVPDMDSDFLVMELEPSAVYEFRFALMNDGGRGPFSAPLVILMEDSAPEQPVIEGYNSTEKADAGDTLHLVCSSRGGISPLTLKWYKNGTELPVEAMASGDGWQIPLEVVVQEDTDGTEFTCEASNSVATLNTSIIVNGNEVLPDPPPTPRVTVLGMTTVAVEWDDVELPSTPYVLRYNKRNGTTHEIVVPDMDSDFLVMELEPSAVYEFRFALMNDGGRGPFSAPLVILMEDSGVCELPESWTGEWHTDWDQAIISSSVWLGQECLKSSKDRFLVKKEWRGCNTCYVVKEKHPNILEYQESKCEETDDLQALCSTISDDNQVMKIMRVDGVSRCPFAGSRSFTSEQHHGSCNDTPSRLASEDNDTALVFHFDPCPDEATLHIAMRSEKIECVGTWSEGSTYFLMGKLESLLGGEPRYRCFTYSEEFDKDYEYFVGRTSSRACGAPGYDFDNTYRVYKESVAPGAPVIKGHDAEGEVEIGSLLNLTCSSRSGFPRAQLKWFRNGEELETDTYHDDENSTAVIQIVVRETDDGTEYVCKAYNFAGAYNTSTIIHIMEVEIPAYENIMVPKIITVEDETTFLPCITTKQQNVKVDWFDADLDTQLTSGDHILTEDKSNLEPFTSKDLKGLMVQAGFVDTNYACNVQGRRVGNTTVVILSRYLIEEDANETYHHLEDTDTYKLVSEGEQVSLDCTVASNVTSVLVRWRRYPGSLLLTQGNLSLAEDEGYTIDVSGNSYVLRVAKTDIRHAGSYFCQIIINEEEVFTKNFTIDVAEVIKTYMGQDATISCHSPKGQAVKYIHEGKEIKVFNISESEKYIIPKTGEGGLGIPGLSGTLFTLTVSNASLEHEGIYQCVTIGDSEEVLREAVLQVDLEEFLPITTDRTNEHLTTPTPEIRATTESSSDDEPSTTMTSKLDMETTTHISTDVDGSDMRPTGASEMPGTTTTDSTETTTIASSPAAVTASPKESEIPSTTIIYDVEPDIYYYDELPLYEKVVLQCEGSSHLKLEDISWKSGDNLLFLGQLNLAAVPGLSISSEGALVLAAGSEADTRDGDTYTCFGFDSDTFDDVILITYHVSLSGEDTVIEKISKGRTDKEVISKPKPQPEPEAETPDLAFDALKEDELVILGNTRRVGRRIEEVLQSGGLDVRLHEETLCRSPNETRSWAEAQKALEDCESAARSSVHLEDKSLIIGLDFYVELSPSSWFALTKLYLHNKKRNAAVSVFAPMVPVPPGKVKSFGLGQQTLIEASESWWDSVQGTGNTFGNALAASILSLQESYQTLLKDDAAASNK